MNDDIPAPIVAGEEVRKAFHQLATVPLSPADLTAAMERFRRAIVMLGYGTADNQNSAQLVTYAATAGRESTASALTFPRAALRLVGKDIPLSNIFFLLEEAEVHPAVRRAFPELTQDDWDAVMRVAGMLLCSVDQSLADTG